MREILTITLNPAVDLDSSVAEVTPGLLAACADPAPKTWPCAQTRCEWRPINGAAQ